MRGVFHLVLAILILTTAGVANAAQDDTSGDAVLNAIKTRRSVRTYADRPVAEAAIKNMLEAAMLAPSAVNEQPWEFVVIQDKQLLKDVASEHPNAAFAAQAPLAILACLNEQKLKAPGMGQIDLAMAAQNLLLAAHAQGLGAVFTGIYPLKEKMESFRKMFGLPDYVEPAGLIVIGYPRVTDKAPVPNRYNPKAVHQNKWRSQ